MSYGYCEMCGRPTPRRDMKIIFVENVKLSVCPSCYSRVVRSDVAREIKEVTSARRGPEPARPPARSEPRVRERELLEGYEVVPDYAERIRQARERLGLTQKALADLVKESENTIKRIESGRLVPTIPLAKRLEEVLSVKLLEPVVDNPAAALPSPAKMRELTLGDVVSIRRREK